LRHSKAPVGGSGILEQLLKHGAANASPAVVVVGYQIVDPNALAANKQCPDGDYLAMKRS
jgi:hypothetical protein